MNAASNIFRSPTASLFVGKLGQVASHVHRAAAMVLPLDGPIRFRTEAGTWQHCFGAWVPPRCVHRLDCDQRQVAVLYLDPLRYGASLAAAKLASADQGWARRASDTLGSKLPELVRTGELASTEAHFAHELLERAGRAPAKQDPLACDVRDLMSEIPITELDLKRAASELTLSPSRFSHLFSQQFGLSYTAYRNWRRLLHVSTALWRAPESISELAFSWGYSSHAHLAASLRAGFGLTPSQLRALRPQLVKAAR